MGQSSLSIKDYATLRARKLAIRISIVGFILSSIVLIASSLLAYYMRLDGVSKAVTSSISSSMQVGDVPQLNRTMLSISRGDGVISAKVFSNKGLLIASSRPFDSKEMLAEKTEYGLGIEGSPLNPFISFRVPINYGFEKSGTFELIASLPIGLLMLGLSVIGLLFFLGSIVVVRASQRTALAIAAPASDLANELKNAKDNFASNSRQASIEFKEIEQVRSEFSFLLDRIRDSQEKEKSAQREALAGRIATKVRHDVKQALLASDAILKRLSGQPEHLDLMRTALRRIESTVEEIPKFSQSKNSFTDSKSAEVRDTTEQVSLIELVFPVTKEFQAIVNSDTRKIKIETVYDKSLLSLKVKVDSLKFRRMLANILGNAMDSIAHSGEIRVLVRLLDSKTVALIVKDNGKGIPLNVLPSIGKHGFSFGKNNGSGVGLSSAIEYVNSWNGDIQIASEEGKGTVLTISLPIQDITSNGISNVIQISTAINKAIY